MSDASQLSVVLDTNIFISSVIRPSGPAVEIVERWKRREFRLVMDDDQLSEVVRVLRRPKIVAQYSVEDRDVDELISLISVRSSEQTRSLPGHLTVRDPDDVKILASALAARADFLVTGDKDLLVLASHPDVAPTRIVGPAEFVLRLRQRHSE